MNPVSGSRSLWELLKATFNKWSEDSAARLAAALSYYAIFSIGPLLFIAITLVGLIFGHRAAQDQIRPQITSLVGSGSAKFIQDMIVKVGHSATLSVAGIISLVLIIYAATNLFVSLQDALNVIFAVAPKPGRGVREMVRDRALSVVMVAIVGVFVLASIVLSTLLVAITKNLTVGNPTVTAWLFQGANFLISTIVFTAAFAVIFKYLPDIKIDWHDTLIGATFTAVLFSLARIGLGYYLGRSSTTGPFGAAGSLVIVMLFIYYSSQIFFLGAEFTKVWACREGNPIVPSDNAISLKVLPKKAQKRQKMEENRKKRQEIPPELGEIAGSEVGGHWQKAGGGRGWDWVPEGAPPMSSGQSGSSRIWRPIGRLHPPMRFPRQTAPLATAGVAALVVLPVAWFYLRKRT